MAYRASPLRWVRLSTRSTSSLQSKLRDRIGTGIGALQLGIALTGNFGHFNLLTLALCVPLLECGGGAGGMDSPLTSVAEAIATATPLQSPFATIANTAIYYFFGETGSNISAVSETDLVKFCAVFLSGVVGLINLLFNSWCARSWTFWPALSGEPVRHTHRPCVDPEIMSFIGVECHRAPQIATDGHVCSSQRLSSFFELFPHGALFMPTVRQFKPV